MANDVNSNFYKASQGSLTGFDTANLPTGNPNLAVTGWSLEELRAFLSNQSDLNFPSNEWVLAVEDQIRSHVTDYNNPHRVSLDQIVGDFVSEVLGNVVPGTVPDLPPFFSFDAGIELPLGDIFPAAFSSINLYRMTAGGILIDPSTESEQVGTDYNDGAPGIPLFAPMTNIVPATWSAQAGSRLNVSFTTLSNPALSYPFSFTQASEINVTGSFGISIPMTQALQTGYSLTLLIAPSSVGGTVRIAQAGNTLNYMDVNLADGSSDCSTSAVIGNTTRYADGVIKVAFGFISTSPTAINAVTLIHTNPGDTTSTRTGTAGRALFSVAIPVATLSSITQPVMINPAIVASAGPITMGLGNAGAPATMPNLLLTTVWNLEPWLSAVGMTDTSLLQMGALTITRDATNVYVNVSGTRIFTSAILQGLNNFTLSYSPTTLIFKDLSNLRAVSTGTYPALSTALLKAGPCSGYLKSLALYAMADKTQCVEYLNNG